MASFEIGPFKITSFLVSLSRLCFSYWSDTSLASTIGICSNLTGTWAASKISWTESKINKSIKFFMSNVENHEAWIQPQDSKCEKVLVFTSEIWSYTLSIDKGGSLNVSFSWSLEESSGELFLLGKCSFGSGLYKNKHSVYPNGPLYSLLTLLKMVTGSIQAIGC